MNTTRLEEFMVLARVLNYSKASDILFISQSVLSRHIKETEEELGVTLFDRDTHGVYLTDDGKYLLRWTQPLLDKADHIISSMAVSADQGVSNEVKIICDEQSLGSEVIDFIHVFIDKYHDVKLDISISSESITRDTVYSSDVVITTGDFSGQLNKDIEGQLLFTYRTILAIPPFHRFGDKTEIALEELKGETLIVPHAVEVFEAYARNSMLANRKCHGVLHRLGADTPQNGLLMVELRKGLMLIPHHMKNMLYPRTRAIPVTDSECTFPVYIYRRTAHDNEGGRLFYESLIKEFRLQHPELRGSALL